MNDKSGSDNVLKFSPTDQSRLTEPKRPLRGGGEPPYNDGMETRVTKLEDDVSGIRQILASINTKLEFMATKEDIAKLDGKIENRPTIFQFAALTSIIIAVGGLLFKNMDSISKFLN